MTAPADLNDPEVVVDLLERAAAALLEHPTRAGASVRIPARGRLLATGDLHDNPFHFKSVVAAARLDASPDHHLTLHELIHGDRLLNGMDFSYRMLAKAAELVLRFPGQVHPLLANHELAQLIRRGVSKGAGDGVKMFRAAIDYAFGDDAARVEAAVDAFVRAMPLALRSASGVLCAHSLPSAPMMDRFDPDVLDRPLTDADYAHPDGGAYLMTWGRGYTEASVAALAERWDVRLFVLGHQHVVSGVEAFGSRVIILNSDHEQGRMLPIDLARPLAADEAPLYALPM